MCGNGVVEPGEACDGADLGACRSCDMDATIDPERCACASFCGDGARQGGPNDDNVTERCDGADSEQCPAQCRDDCSCPGLPAKSSCPILYAWDGEGFAFVTDVLGNGVVGFPLTPSLAKGADPVEWVRLPPGLPRERDGLLELRVVEQLAEVTFLDGLELVAVDHPAGTEAFPLEGVRMFPPYLPEGVALAADARPPRSATDGDGRDLLASLAAVDGVYAPVEPLPYEGYARQHALELDLGDLAGADRVLLLLTGGTRYPQAYSTAAAWRDGVAMELLSVQVPDGAGGWRSVVEDAPFPAGLPPKTVTLDLTGLADPADPRVRLSTGLAVHWDRALVSTRSTPGAPRMTRLAPARAELRWRGFPAPLATSGPFPRYGYGLDGPGPDVPEVAGNLTRYGDILPLLAPGDDRFAAMGPGDEAAVAFDASALPPLPAGTERTLMLRADGFFKELYEESPAHDAVEPLPFYGMQSYPPHPGEGPPRERAAAASLLTRPFPSR